MSIEDRELLRCEQYATHNLVYGQLLLLGDCFEVLQYELLASDGHGACSCLDVCHACLEYVGQWHYDCHQKGLERVGMNVDLIDQWALEEDLL